MDIKKYNVSQHAKERYAERIMERNDTTEVRKFVNDHDRDICNWINELVTYGEMIYEGNILDKGNQQVFFKDGWVVVVDPRKNNVVTLYKINLGDDEVTNLFISKMMTKINEAKESVNKLSEERNSHISEWQQVINSYQSDIDYHKKQIKQEEEIIDSYKTLIKNANVDISNATYNVQLLVEQLICKRHF